MVFTLDNCLSRLNQVLNYPMLEYTDVEHYFDQAISELNTSLRIGIKPLSVIISEQPEAFKGMSNVVVFTAPLTNASIPNSKDDQPTVYYDTTCNKFGILKNNKYEHYNKVYGVYSGIDVNSGAKIDYVYQSVWYNDDAIMWTNYEEDKLKSINLIDYFPMDVLNLFIIPYVCFKFTVRNGGDASIFVDEYVQGFQQIQTSYDIPNFVLLSQQAGLPAYTEDVKENLSNLNIKIPTRAIYDSMKVGDSFMPTYGGMYDNGGWGI